MRPRLGRRMQADEDDAIGRPAGDGPLQAGRIGAHGDPVGPECQGLVHPVEPARRAALAVDDGDFPADALAGFAHEDAVEATDVVLLVAGEIDELLAGLRLRAFRGATPSRSAARRSRRRLLFASSTTEAAASGSCIEASDTSAQTATLVPAILAPTMRSPPDRSFVAARLWAGSLIGQQLYGATFAKRRLNGGSTEIAERSTARGDGPLARYPGSEGEERVRAPALARDRRAHLRRLRHGRGRRSSARRHAGARRSARHPQPRHAAGAGLRHEAARRRGRSARPPPRRASGRGCDHRRRRQRHGGRSPWRSRWTG